MLKMIEESDWVGIGVVGLSSGCEAICLSLLGLFGWFRCGMLRDTLYV